MKSTKIILSKYRVLFILNLFSWLITTFGDMVDMVISGYFLGENAVSAVEIITPFSTLLLFASTLIFPGVSSLFAIKEGAFNQKDAKKVAGTGLIISIILGIILPIIMLIFQKSFLGFYESNTVIDLLACDYYRSYIPIAFVYPIYWLIYYLVMIDGDMTLVFTADIVNVVANLFSSIWLLNIFGIKGIGYGTLVGMILSGITLLFHFIKKSNTVQFSFKISLKFLWESIKISSSTALVILYIGITDIVMNKIVLMLFNEQYLAVYGVINLILNLGVCLVCAMSAAEPFVCTDYGENNYQALESIMHTTTRYTFVLSIIFVLLLECISFLIPSLFGITEAKLIEDTIFAIRVLGVSYLASGFLSEIIAYYSKINHAFLANILGAIHMLIGPLAIVIPLSFSFGFKGMVWGFFGVPFITIIIGFLIIFKKYGYKKIPYIINNQNNIIKIIDINTKNFIADDFFLQVKNFLKNNNIEDNLNKDIQNCAKHFLSQSNLKKCLIDCTIMIENNEIRMIFRDNGKIVNKKKQNYNCTNYLYSVVTGFNRNCFIWEID